MKVAVIGAGRIGGNIARQLAGAGHEITVSFARDQQAHAERGDECERAEVHRPHGADDEHHGEHDDGDDLCGHGGPPSPRLRKAGVTVERSANVCQL